MSSDKQSFVVRQLPEPLKVIGQRLAVLADHAATGSVEVFLQTGVEGTGPGPHSHAWDEAYFMLEGTVELQIAGALVTAAAGEFVYIPGGTVHGFKVKSPTARFLSINSAQGAAEFFGEVSREVGDTPDFPKLMAIGSRHGVAGPTPPKHA